MKFCASQNWTAGESCNETAPAVFSETSARIFQLTVVFVGMPISGFTSFVIISSRQLWEPRHLSLLPLITFHILLFVQSTLYYLANVHHLTICCRIFTIFYGVPYMLVDVSYVLIVIERYIAICHPSIHQKLWFLLGSKDPCSDQYIKLTPFLSMAHFGLFSVFLFFQLRIITKLRSMLRMYPSLKRIKRRVVVFRSSRCGFRSGAIKEEEIPSALSTYFARFRKTPEPEASVSTTHSTEAGTCNCSITSFGKYLSTIRQRRMNQIEVKVTISLAVVSFPQLIFCLPYAGGLSLSFFTHLYYSDLNSYYQMCIRLQQYFQAVYLMYVVCFPLLYVALNREFRQAVRRKIPL